MNEAKYVKSCRFGCAKLLLCKTYLIFPKTVPLRLEAGALLTHILTQTAKTLCGNSGYNGAKQYLEPERKGQTSAQKGQMDTRAVAHNPEVAGSSPVSATMVCDQNRYAR